VKKTVSSEKDMRALGERLGALLHGNETIELIGDVGAGKTTFVKGLAVGLGVDEDVQSPSFTISRVYDAKDGGTLAHYDFYRLGEAGILSEDVQESMVDNKTITVIEWAGIVDDRLPSDRIQITISPDSETSRIVEIMAASEVEARL
jgi:tRNA threonylcarbamoyladenosine biosynthesis protein TsaE